MRQDVEEALRRIQVLTHSSIRISAGSDGPVLYLDPYEVQGEPKDADVIFFTHSHYDHFSPDDFRKLMKEDTMFVMPQSMIKEAAEAGITDSRIVSAEPGESSEVCGIPVFAVPAYNVGKKFHPKENRWVGYLLSIHGVRIYVAGDTDANPENRNVLCDIALVPAGGTYTFTPEEAADFVNEIHPEAAIPTHYGTVAGTPADGKKFAARVNPDIAVKLCLFQ
ncbi:MAG: MBL fold metallo-hydrolase [Eubacteriales bacterium]|nr:MBL fold metallo-hydrolase [Eubacteriales bacterium]